MKKSWLAFLFVCMSISASAQLRINAQLLVDSKTINLTQLVGVVVGASMQSSGGTFLSMNINNDADEPKMATLTATLSYNGQELAKGRTRNKVRLAPRAAVRLTNNNFVGGEWATIGRTENAALLEDMRNKGGGKLPNGSYMLTWTLETDDGGFTSFPLSFTVAGSREAFVRLISPGAHAGDKADAVTTKFPVFQWTGSADSYTFNLWEDVNKTGNVAAVISLPPMVSARNLTQTTVRYEEVGGSRELQAGKQYIWSVEASVTGGGKVTDAFIFTVAETVK